MCDFHSIIVSTDGRVYHLPENSHSGIAAHYGLENTPENRQFYEVEWSGRGDMPDDLVRDRSYGVERDIPALVHRTAERHYTKLAAILRGELLAADTAPFDQPEYSDVAAELERYNQWLIDNAARIERERVEEERRQVAAAEKAAREAEAEELAAKVYDQLEADLINVEFDGRAAFVRALLAAMQEEASDVFGEEFDEAKEEAEDRGKEAGYEDGHSAGYESASEDMYTSEYVTEYIGDFIDKDEWVERSEVKEEFAEEFAAAREEGFKEGFKAAKEIGRAHV